MSSDDDDTENIQFKVIVMGDGAVGKTSLINRFCKDGFGQSYKQTIGIDFFNKKVTLGAQSQTPVHVTLQIWDIGGQQIGGKMLGKYIYGADAVLLVYDMTNVDSFKNVDDWHIFAVQEFTKEIEKSGQTMPTMALVGNKIDLIHLRQIKVDKHNACAQEKGLKPFFVSAKSGEKVNSMFMQIAAELAGVKLSSAEIAGADKVFEAKIVQHPDGGPIPEEKPRAPPETKKDGDCIVA